MTRKLQRKMPYHILIRENDAAFDVVGMVGKWRNDNWFANYEHANEYVDKLEKNPQLDIVIWDNFYDRVNWHSGMGIKYTNRHNIKIDNGNGLM